MKPIKEGKVRQIYDNGDNLIMVATDRISCFDVILNNVIDKKGSVLTQMSKFWFDYTKDIIDNHMISTSVKDMPEFFQTPEFEGKAMMCKKLQMLPLECIVRGYITGSGWASYKKDGTVCGIKLPEGLKESEKLPEPIYTPSTKAELGDHDVNISFEESIEYLEKLLNHMIFRLIYLKNERSVINQYFKDRNKAIRPCSPKLKKKCYVRKGQNK